ncbi:MAG: metal ABC transporter solute-binding protein, Zn/Mn family [Halomonas sp.]|uniref:Manganese transporter n=2 Tax=Halomonas TaxID=2745 RepID=A0A3D0KBN5_9GAMM|nr:MULTISPECIES: zinc ABC transporter substrate-binding protein [unclassified Halomonas]WKD28151.1 zinc ABC transporter substrate-binding protein [Halomonas sp. KG2]HBP41208.1 manganese transporter [Halomonas sp.]HBS82941.1 manganese transporter [Halomonas campaniensis]HCA00720.1 manganese transporter [Halomonas campaniensis]
MATKHAVILLTTLPLSALATADTPPLNVVATIGMIADVAQEVGGECVNVEAMMGPGVDPHLYQASASDVATLRNAEQIFYSGYSLEGQLGDVLERFSERTPTLAVAPASIDPASLITSQDVYGIDPHLWMDVSLWAQTLPTLNAALSEARPDCAATFDANTERYQTQLLALHEWVTDSIASIPDEQRILVTAHDAFGYFGRAYDIDVEGIQGISTETETGIADIRNMTDIVVDRAVPALFIESTINPRTVQAVIDAAQQRGQVVEIGGELYSDAMGDPDTVDGTYMGMIYRNTQHIVEALGGTLAPLPEAMNDWATEWKLAH